MAVKTKHETLTMTNAGQAYQVSATTKRALTVTFEADNLNSGKIYIGDSSVTTSNGITLGPGESVSITTDPSSISGFNSSVKMDSFYCISSNAGNVVRIHYAVNV
jgi:hypothetical protein